MKAVSPYRVTAVTKSIEYYLSKGFERKYAEYYASGRKKLVSAEPNSDFTLTLTFENGERRLFDASPMLRRGTVFEPFMDFENFKRVYVDRDHALSWDIDPNVDSDVEWMNKVDVCPDSCYVESIPIGGSQNA